MHWSSFQTMNDKLKQYLGTEFKEPLAIVDLGSQRIGNQPLSYRGLVPEAWKYIGVDLAIGNNVDIIMPSEFSIPFETSSINILISGQCLEHCRNPFLLVAEATRVLKPRGWMFITAPAVWPEHKVPIDCFRFYPDGMRAVMEQSGLEVVETFVGGSTHVGGENPTAYDCWGIGRKKDWPRT
jgi:SAM-dependent methyltransferase